MADPYLGEIRMFAGTYAPTGWALCNGQILQMNQYQALYAILGNNYGGTAPNTFAVPNLVGTFPVQPSAPTAVGKTAGAATLTLAQNNLPLHTHTLQDTGHTHAVTVPAHTHPFTVPAHTHPVAVPMGTSGGGGSSAALIVDIGQVDGSATGNFAPITSGDNTSGNGTTGQNAAATAPSASATTGIVVQMSGGAAQPTPLNIMPPTLTVNFIIALEGLWPTHD